MCVLRFCGFSSENRTSALQKEADSEDNVLLDRI